MKKDQVTPIAAALRIFYRYEEIISGIFSENGEYSTLLIK